ncbi:MAG TPA: hypothetical protein VFB25_10880 [Gaiellaceae bacterium]|nr:hypothetical protein [Gaiellaceae bacterium]
MLRSPDIEDVKHGRQMVYEVLVSDTTPGVLLDAAHLALFGCERPR